MNFATISVALGLGTVAALGILETQAVADGSRPERTQNEDRTRVGNETDDKILGAKVNIAINSEKGLTDGTYSVHVTAKDGVATLDGKMPTDDRKKRCEVIAKGVSGVKSVVNKIEVPRPEKEKDGGK